MAIREEFPHYRIAVFAVKADEDTVRERILARAKATGRTVDESYIKYAFDNIKASLTIVADDVDFIATIDNSGTKSSSDPTLASFKVVDRTHDWSVLQHRFTNHDTRHGKGNAILLVQIQVFIEAVLFCR